MLSENERKIGMKLDLKGQGLLSMSDARIAEGPDISLFGWSEGPSPDVRDPGDWKNVVFGPDGEPVRISNHVVLGQVVREHHSSIV
jgi:hypothetical protein